MLHPTIQPSRLLSKPSVSGLKKPGFHGLLAVLLLTFCLFPACSYDSAKPPANYKVIEVSGDPYERGLQHGRALAGNIRSFYRKFLSAGIIPYLNSEQWQIEEFLTEYQKPEYDNAQFGYQILLQSARSFLKYIPEDYQQEMQGVADGCKMSFDQIVILNTFFDTLFGMRSIIFVIRNLQDPTYRYVDFEAYEEADDEWKHVAAIKPFEPSPFGSLVEIPTNVRMRFMFQDPEGVDPDSVRILLGYDGENKVYTHDDEIVTTRVSGKYDDMLEVLFTPPEPLPPATLISLQIKVNDLDFVEGHGPRHAHVMRDDRFVFTTTGHPVTELHELFNKGERDERLQPVSIGFALRGKATTDGKVLAAHHFTGLDNDTAHKNAAVIIHRPGNGKKDYVTVGFAGVVYGSSGMNSDGLVTMFNLSDTLDNPVTEQVLNDFLGAKLISKGIPIGFLLREILEKHSTVEEGREALKDRELTFGWNVLLADASGSMAVVEIDADILDNALNPGYYTYSPDDTQPWRLDPWGRQWASVDTDDIRMSMHYQANSEDININFLGFPILSPQRYWTSYYYRSLRTFYVLGEEIQAAYEDPLDLNGVIRVMRNPDLEDQRNSMNAAIFAPGDLKLWYALGEVPATSAPFREVDFGAMIGKKGE